MSSISLENPQAFSQQSRLKNLFNPSAFLDVITTSSLIFKALCIGVIIGYLTTFTSDLDQILCIIPGKLLPPNFYLWTLFTHGFIEYRFIELILNCFLILLYSKMLEPLWGQIECIQFYFITTISVGLSTTIIYFILYAATFDELMIFNVSIHGLGGLLGGFTVATKQIMPDTVLVDFNFIKMRQDNLPLLTIFVSMLFYLFGLTKPTYFIMVTFGVFYGWVYLRFFQKHKNGTRGDSSSTFVFASLFPSQIQPFVAIFSNTIFNLLVKLKICKQPPKRYTMAGGSQSSQSHITITIPLVKNNLENSDAERRRLKALKALKDRLKKPGEDDDL
ncbi:unnamed protein product, partial [Brachionus calyciflorus]